MTTYISRCFSLLPHYNFFRLYKSAKIFCLLMCDGLCYVTLYLATYIKTYVSTYQVAATKLLILKLFTPCIYDQYISLLQPKYSTISYAFNSTDNIAAYFLKNMLIFGSQCVYLKDRFSG